MGRGADPAGRRRGLVAGQDLTARQLGDALQVHT